MKWQDRHNISVPNSLKLLPARRRGYLLKLSACAKSGLPVQKCKEIKKVEKLDSDIASQKWPYLP